MSSTCFKSVRALKTDISFYDGRFIETNYVLIVETADSNLYNSNGGHDYHEWIYASGNYIEVLREVCRYSIDFDTGIAKWKPNDKDSCGFIRMCKKALKNAKQETTLPYRLRGIIFKDNEKIFNHVFELLKNNENVVAENLFGQNILTSRDIKTYILLKHDIKNMIKDYKENFVKHNASPSSFEEFVEEHKTWYKNLC